MTEGGGSAHDEKVSSDEQHDDYNGHDEQQ